MNYPFLVIAAIAIFTLSCNEKNPPPKPETAVTDSVPETAKVPQQYFPVADFLRNEIDYVDSLPIGIMKYRTRNSKTDSGYIKLDEFHRLAGQFLSTELMEPAFAKEFKETSFFDRSNNNATFFYSSDNDSLPVKRVDVVTTKGDVYDDVKSIYIEKLFHRNDSLTILKLIWKPKRNFQIIRITSTGSEDPKNELIKVVWDNRE
jgi:hypothetical protein